MLDHSHELSGTTFVTAANRSGARDAIDHLDRPGPSSHRLHHGQARGQLGRERLAGYRDALQRRRHRPTIASLVVEGDFLEDRGYGATRELLSLDAAADGHLHLRRHRRLRGHQGGP